MPDFPDDTYPEAETVARREAILKRVLATPPKPKGKPIADDSGTASSRSANRR